MHCVVDRHPRAPAGVDQLSRERGQQQVEHRLTLDPTPPGKREARASFTTSATFDCHGRRARCEDVGVSDVGTYDGDDFFCDVAIPRAVPLEVVHEDDLVLAYHHTRPFWQVHLVAVPKAAHRLVHDDRGVGRGRTCGRSSRSSNGSRGRSRRSTAQPPS